jgi:hypothetical protein
VIAQASTAGEWVGAAAFVAFVRLVVKRSPHGGFEHGIRMFHVKH